MSRNLHLICREFKGVTLLSDVFETESWCVSDKSADDLKGGNIYLHETQSSPPYLSGQVLECVRDIRPGFESRKIFICKKINNLNNTHISLLNGVKRKHTKYFNKV